jgi:hypothetical protein
LEHVVDPLELLRNLRKITSDGGCAVISVPNDFSVTQLEAINRGHIDQLYFVAPPDHLNYFNYNSLIQATAACGWKHWEVISNFPVDWFLFHPGSNYINTKEAGKYCHLARVQIENLIDQNSMPDVLLFWSSMAALGMGRNLKIFLQ